MTKVLLLAASFGDGHRQAANALRESFSKRNATVYEVDCFEGTNKLLAYISQWTYETITRYLPGLYGATYHLTANIRTDSWFWKLLAVSSKKALMKALRQYEPDIVLQLFPDHAPDGIAHPQGKPYWGVVVTDFSVHSHWFHSNADTYFVPNGELIPAMSQFAVNEAELIDAGIPIRSQFRTTKRHKTATEPYILLSTGGRGLFPDLTPVVTAILDCFSEFEVYVLCGRNLDMLHQVQLEASNRPRLHGLSYVDDVGTWFQNASFAIVKSGGITVSELLVCECPMFFYRPQPGQEADNATFLEKMGAGLVIQNPKELKRVLSNPDIMVVIENMKRNCSALARPTAADKIAEHALGRIGKRRTDTGRSFG